MIRLQWATFQMVEKLMPFQQFAALQGKAPLWKRKTNKNRKWKLNCGSVWAIQTQKKSAFDFIHIYPWARILLIDKDTYQAMRKLWAPQNPQPFSSWDKHTAVVIYTISSLDRVEDLNTNHKAIWWNKQAYFQGTSPTNILSPSLSS